MSEERVKILDKAKKIKELADRGVDGEMGCAKDMLKKYMNKHNITMEEITKHDYSSNSVYRNMSDEQFLKEFFKDIVVVGLGLLFTSIFDNKNLNSASERGIERLSQKYGDELKHRTNKK